MFWRKLQRVVSVVFLIAIVGSLLVYQAVGDDFGLGQLRQYIKDFGIWAPLIFIFAYTIITIFIPSTPFMAIAGILFGFWYGLICVTVGGFLSAMAVFVLSRKLGREWAESILEHRYLSPLRKYNGRLESGGIWDLIILRTIPIMPFNVLNILMGISRISAKNYIAGTLSGLIPSNVVAVYFGSFITKML